MFNSLKIFTSTSVSISSHRLDVDLTSAIAESRTSTEQQSKAELKLMEIAVKSWVLAKAQNINMEYIFLKANLIASWILYMV